MRVRSPSQTHTQGFPEGKTNLAQCLAQLRVSNRKHLELWHNGSGWLSKPWINPSLSSLISKNHLYNKKSSSTAPHQSLPKLGCESWFGSPRKLLKRWDLPVGGSSLGILGPGVIVKAESAAEMEGNMEIGSWPRWPECLAGTRVCAEVERTRTHFHALISHFLRCPWRTQLHVRSWIPRSFGWSLRVAVWRVRTAGMRGPASGCSSSALGFSTPSLSLIPSLLHIPAPGTASLLLRTRQIVHKAAGERKPRRRAPSSEITGVINISVPAPRSVRVASLSLPLPLPFPRLCPPSAARGAAPEARSRAGATEPRPSSTRCT